MKQETLHAESSLVELYTDPFTMIVAITHLCTFLVQRKITVGKKMIGWKRKNDSKLIDLFFYFPYGQDTKNESEES